MPGSNTKMIYKNGQGKLFMGSPISFAHGETIMVEASDTPLEDGYYYIIEVIG